MLPKPSAAKQNLTLVMVALWNRADHYIFMLWFLSSSFVYQKYVKILMKQNCD